MFNRIKTFAVGLALAAASAASTAAMWTQTIDPNPDVRVPPSITLNFDLTTVGFNPANDNVTSFVFTVRTRDDAQDGAEWVVANLPGLLADGVWTSPGTYSTGTSLLGAFALNANGLLTATISNCVLTICVGDFIFESATLTATGTRVPEPATLAVVGLALAGLGVQRKRAASK